ncbi:DNA-binding MarR family transcriptional regulator [Elusimicrobium posterum]|uniref:MarR family winged helix-turn-helix transcriptional regulator n=1 Tax=Elusimicrobium posterum TaxID=3116653 RepID=UPI003C776CEE
MPEKEIKEFMAQFCREPELFRGNYALHFFLMIYNQMIKQNAALLSKYHITGPQFDIIIIIKYIGRDHGITQQELSKRLMVTQSGMARIIDRMLNEGFITKKPCPDDRRYNVIKLSKKGEDVFKKAYPKFMNLVSSYTSEIEDVDSLTWNLGSWLYSIAEKKGKKLKLR